MTQPKDHTAALAKETQPYRRDLMKLICLVLVLVLASGLFFLVPSLSTPALISFVATLILSPLAARLERRGFSRSKAIGIIFAGLGTVLGITGIWITQSVTSEWDSLRETAPRYFIRVETNARALEKEVKQKHPFLENIQATDSVIAWVNRTARWFIDHGPSVIGDFATCVFVVPLLTFFLLKDGRRVRKKFFDLVPNCYFENSVIITTKIMSSFSDYVRAKLLEAFIVGSITAGGLAVIKAPYILFLAAVAGITNIIPYLGPIFGAIPGLVIVASDPAYAQLLWPLIAVYAVANLIDMMVLFPILVAKLVNLHPMFLIIAVMVGQQYYGLVGMLISIPVATGLKVVFQEIYAAIYEHGSSKRISVPV